MGLPRCGLGGLDRRWPWGGGAVADHGSRGNGPTARTAARTTAAGCRRRNPSDPAAEGAQRLPRHCPCQGPAPVQQYRFQLSADRAGGQVLTGGLGGLFVELAAGSGQLSRRRREYSAQREDVVNAHDRSGAVQLGGQYVGRLRSVFPQQAATRGSPSASRSG